jgi:hypothetical protein
MHVRRNIATGAVLILVGAVLMAMQLVPSLKEFFYSAQFWPFWIIGTGALLGLLALVLWVPGMWVPACIVGGIGGLLYYQNLTGDWASWAYAWALIPGFSGVGTFLAGVFSRDRRAITGGLWTVFISLVMFAIFGSFLGGITLLSIYWPVLLIGLGVVLLVSGFFRKR